METSIQISDMVEDSQEPGEETKKEIALARAGIKERRFHSLSEVVENWFSME
jgi:hypothetical protein